MSDPDEGTSLIEGQDEGGGTNVPETDPPADESLTEDVEEQERGGWMNEPTTG